MTSRSFAFVIKELQGDLCRAICIFYLVLRALDTIEDDMTIKIEVKVRELEAFYKRLKQPGWHFDDCKSQLCVRFISIAQGVGFAGGPTEKDRQLLVEFGTVIEEFARLDPK